MRKQGTDQRKGCLGGEHANIAEVNIDYSSSMVAVEGQDVSAFEGSMADVQGHGNVARGRKLIWRKNALLCGRLL